MKTASKMVSLVVLGLAASVLPGCYADEEVDARAPAGAPEAEVYEGYRPMYYNGYVVYYDNVGRPFYYGPRGAVAYVSPRYAGYGVLVGHYHAYRAVYPHWYARYGVRYRGFRRW